MGKNQHSKDKLYMTATEAKTFKKAAGPLHALKKLPYSCCALSLRPFADPVCTADGRCFEVTNILPWIKKHKCCPVTNAPLAAKDLLALYFHKNCAGEFHCPVLQKPFTDHTAIVAIRTSGNVYCRDAVRQLNFKTKDWHDLLSGEPFTKADVITLQDPQDAGLRTIDKFAHVAGGKGAAAAAPTAAVGGAAAKSAGAGPSSGGAAARTASQRRIEAHYSTGRMAQSLTSTAVATATVNTRAEKSPAEQRRDFYRHVKKKGYVKLETSHGDLNLELHCDQTPRACENFVRHCQSGYYNGTKFHRSIRDFMVQGGDPDGTGCGGKSVWGEEFPDEPRATLSHSGRGILAMANRGPATNGSQFYITFAACTHLDMKHTIFGRVVGGLETLGHMESVDVDSKDRPRKPIELRKAQVFVNPFDDARAALDNADREADEAAAKAAAPVAVPRPKPTGGGVGRYLPAKKQRTDG